MKNNLVKLSSSLLRESMRVFPMLGFSNTLLFLEDLGDDAGSPAVWLHTHQIVTILKVSLIRDC